MDELDETVLNIQQRQKRGLIMRRYKAKIERAKELSQKRMADDKKIKKRAYAQARQIVRKRVAGKRGAEYEKLGPSEKMAIDRAIDKKAASIKKLALRLIPKVKQAEQQRLHSFMKGQAIHNFGKPEGHHTEKASPGSAVSEELNLLFAEAFNNEQEVDQTNDANDVQMKKKKGDGNKSSSKSASIKMYNKFGEAIIVSKSVFEGLSKKAERSGIDIETLAEVYSRGRDAWNDNGKIGQDQYAFARVNSFINEGSSYYELDADLHGEELTEKRGLWDNIHAKRKRIKAGSGERMRKPGSKGAPTAQDFRDAQESVEIDEARSQLDTHASMLVDKHGNNLTHGHITAYAGSRGLNVDKLTKAISKKTNIKSTKSKPYITHDVDHMPGQTLTAAAAAKQTKDVHAAWAARRAKLRNEEIELDESFRKWQIQQNLGKSKKEFLSPPNTVGGMSTKRIHHNEKHDIEVYHGMQVYKTTPHYVFHNDKLVHMTTSRDNAMNHAEKLGRKLDREEKKSVKEEVQIDEAKSLTQGINHLGKRVFDKRNGKTGVVQNSYSDGSHSIKWKGSKKPTTHDWMETKSHIRIATSGDEHKKYVKEESELDENAWNQLGQKKPVGNMLPAPARGTVPKHGRKFSEGDHVVPHTGPHAGEVHRVTSSRAGSVNIVHPNGKYDTVTVRAKHEHLSPATPEQTTKYKAAREAEHKRMFGEDIEESNNTPYVRPHIEKGSTKQTGWKASNKHGRVKYFGMDFKKSAEKHAGINEETESVGTKVRKKMEIVDRKPKTPGVYTKQAEVKNKIIDEEGNVQNDPKKRLTGTDSLVNAYKKDTPGQGGDINESFNIAFAAGVGVSLTAADLGMKSQGGFALHPSVIAEMEARELEEDAVSAEKKPVYMPPRRKQDGSYTAAKTVLRKSGRKIIAAKEPEDVDSDEHDGK